MRKETPIKEKINLSLEETAVYSNIGIHELRQRPTVRIADFGTKCLTKRKKIMNTPRTLHMSANVQPKSIP